MHRPVSSLFCLAIPLLFACADDGNAGNAEGTEDDTATTGDGDGDTNTEASEQEGDGDGDNDLGDGDGDPGDGDGDPGDGDGDDPGDGDGDPGDGDGDGDDEVLRFIAIGDAGEGNSGQYNVAAAIEAVCADKGGCEFVLYLGDNFYDNGVSSVDDDQFQTKFELPYADLTMPFWVVMGNHDYGELSWDWNKLQYEIEYSNYSEKWRMPAKWYLIDEYPNVDIFALDTNRLMWDNETSQQRNWLNSGVQASTKTWKIAIGHHPYYSNGKHGNAGNYEGLPWLPIVSGKTVKEFMDGSVCGKIDLYLSGHDHNRQWPQGTCGGDQLTTRFIVSGAGSKTTDFEHRDNNAVFWEDDDTPGFLLLELSSSQIYTAFYDENANLEFEHTITK